MDTPSARVKTQRFEFTHETCVAGAWSRFRWDRDEDLIDKKTATYQCEGCGEVLTLTMPKATQRLRGRLVERRRKEVVEHGTP